MKLSPAKFRGVFGTIALLMLATSQPNAKRIDADTVEAKNADTHSADSYQLLLIGGGLKVCHASDPEYCEQDTTATAQKLDYQLSGSTLNPIKSLSAFHKLEASTQQHLNNIFTFFENNPTTVSSPAEIKQAFSNVAITKPGVNALNLDAGTVFNNLPDDIYYAILDYSQQSLNTDNKPSDVDLNNSKSQASKQLLYEFIQQAELKRKPDEILKIGFLTSSARDPYSAVGYYQQIFEQAARHLSDKPFEVYWLPLDKTLSQALEIQAEGMDGCGNLEALRRQNQVFNAKARYPELVQQQTELCEKPDQLTELFSKAHGIFINGGDQRRTLSIFRDSHNQDTLFKTLIADRLQNNQLILAGTSAGAAVQSGGVFNNRPIPMITGGTSEAALIRGAFALPPAPFGCEKDGNCPYGLIEDDLTYESRGGLGTFVPGILDTHFSERDRHARLTVLTAASRTRFGFGIDENTGLLVNTHNSGNIKMTVIGENGVFVIDMQNAIVKTQAGKHQIIALSHYLNNNDEMNFQKDAGHLEFSFSSQSQNLSTKNLLFPNHQGEFRKQISINCGMNSFHRWTEKDIAWLVNPSPDTRFLSNKYEQKENCSFINLLFGIEN